MSAPSPALLSAQRSALARRCGRPGEMPRTDDEWALFGAWVALSWVLGDPLTYTALGSVAPSDNLRAEIVDLVSIVKQRGHFLPPRRTS